MYAQEQLRLFLCFIKNLNFVPGMTRRFVSAKRPIRYFLNSSKLFEHRAQSLVREVKMLAVWPSFAERFPTARSRVICKEKLSSTCEEFKCRGWYYAAFRFGQETHQIRVFEFHFIYIYVTEFPKTYLENLTRH